MPHAVSLALQEWVVSNLGSVHTLNLSNCENLKDVGDLGSVHTLDLSYCKNISNISMLSLLHTLNLRDCKNIKDVGNLRKLKKIIINKKVYGLYLLKELEELTITKECKLKMKREIKKLKRLNKKVEIKFI